MLTSGSSPMQPSGTFSRVRTLLERCAKRRDHLFGGLHRTVLADGLRDGAVMFAVTTAAALMTLVVGRAI